MREKINFKNYANEALTIDECFKKFITTKRAMRLSERTISFYEDCFRYFTAFCNENAKASDITKDTMIGYLCFINETKPHLSDTTIDSYMRGTKPFIKFFMDCGYTEKFDFPVVKTTEHLKETYTDEQLDKLLVKPDITKCGFSDYRDWVIICHILATGNRAGTVCTRQKHE